MLDKARTVIGYITHGICILFGVLLIGALSFGVICFFLDFVLIIAGIKQN